MKRVHLTDVDLWENDPSSAITHEDNETLNPDAIVAALKTQWWGKRCVVGESIASTIDVAKLLLAEGTPHGTLVLANHQTGGRGRRGHAWNAPAGKDLLLTFIVRCPEAFAAPLLSMYSTGAIAHCLRDTYTLDVSVKWPNDVYLQERKLAGSMVETVDEFALVSLGINVNSRAEDRPSDVRDTAISLSDASGDTWNRTALLASMGFAWETLWQQWNEQGTATLVEQWRAVSLLDGRHVQLHYRNELRTVQVMGVSDSGSLQVMDAQGQPHEWPAEHISQVRILA